jgi:hypothetical protein
MAAGRKKGCRKTGGRKAGVGNKITREAKMALAELCQAYTQEMVEILVTVARDRKATPTARAAAAEAVLDRGNGKPAQYHEMGGMGGGPIEGKITIEFVSPKRKK